MSDANLCNFQRSAMLDIHLTCINNSVAVCASPNYSKKINLDINVLTCFMNTRNTYHNKN